jgi:hypothetical protein
MVREQWITMQSFESERIPLELMIMFQHGIIPVIEDQMDYENNLMKNITIKGQIRKRNIALKMIDFDSYDDEFFRDAMVEIHKQQLSILRTLDNLMTTQFT